MRMNDKEARKIKGNTVKIINVKNMDDDEIIAAILGPSEEDS